MRWRNIALATTLLLSACSDDAGKIQTAVDGMQSQFASDIEIAVDRPSLTVHSATDLRYVVCGKAEFNRQSDYPSTRFDHETRRIIIYVHNSGAVIATLDAARDDGDGKAKFEKYWETRCHS
jgi:hypothetical protein